MTQKTDLSDEGRKRLAEFCGYHHGYRLIDGDDVVYLFERKHGNSNPKVKWGDWQPHSLEAPQWQIHAILEAVEEEGLRMKFEPKLGNLLNGHYEVWSVASAHPAQICRVLLSVNEGDDS